MQTINFKNEELDAVYQFLSNISLVGKNSRSRSFLCKKIAEKRLERAEERHRIQKVHAPLDEKGEIVADKDGTILFEDELARLRCIKEINELEKEKVVINCIEYLDHMSNLLEALNQLEVGLNGEEAYIYDLICEQLETLKFGNEGE